VKSNCKNEVFLNSCCYLSTTRSHFVNLSRLTTHPHGVNPVSWSNTSAPCSKSRTRNGGTSGALTAPLERFGVVLACKVHSWNLNTNHQSPIAVFVRKSEGRNVIEKFRRLCSNCRNVQQCTISSKSVIVVPRFRSGAEVGSRVPMDEDGHEARQEGEACDEG
jgi:hypothetical protein